MYYNNINESKINNKVNFKKSTGENELMLDDKMQSLCQNMANRCEREVPEYGDFAPVKEIFKNPDKDNYSGDIGLICQPSEDEPKQRILRYLQSNPDNVKTLACLVTAGSKDEIMNVLSNKELVKELLDNNARIAKKLKDDDYNQSL